MSSWDLWWWVILPYLALATFVIGHIWRWRYDQFGWTSRSTQLQERRLLKWGGPLFHYGTFAAIAGHVLGILVPESFTRWLGIPEDVYRRFSAIGGTVAALAVILGVVILAFRRTAVPRVRATTSPVDWLALSLLAVVIVLGIIPTMGVNLLGAYHDYRQSVALWFRGLFAAIPTSTRSPTPRSSTRRTPPPPGPSSPCGPSPGSSTPGAFRCGTCGGRSSSTVPVLRPAPPNPAPADAAGAASASATDTEATPHPCLVHWFTGPCLPPLPGHTRGVTSPPGVAPPWRVRGRVRSRRAEPLRPPWALPWILCPPPSGMLPPTFLMSTRSARSGPPAAQKPQLDAPAFGAGRGPGRAVVGPAGAVGHAGLAGLPVTTDPAPSGGGRGLEAFSGPAQRPTVLLDHTAGQTQAAGLGQGQYAGPSPVQDPSAEIWLTCPQPLRTQHCSHSGRRRPRLCPSPAFGLPLLLRGDPSSGALQVPLLDLLQEAEQRERRHRGSAHAFECRSAGHTATPGEGDSDRTPTSG